MPSGAKPVNLHPDAQSELQESVSFYRHRAGDLLAERFKQAVEAAFHAIARDPNRYRPTRELSQARRIRLPPFPFSIIYMDRPSHVWVVAIAHGSRRPGYWIERVQ